MKTRVKVGVATLLAAMLLGLIAPAANAHRWTTGTCSPARNMRWPTSSATYYYPLAFASHWADAISTAHSRITSATDFDWSYSSSSANTWGNWQNPDVSWAGWTDVWADCPAGVSYARIYQTKMYLNFNHFTAPHPNTTERYRCSAIHEAGHGSGFWHSPGTSILNEQHWTQCHENLWSQLQSHDITGSTDFNAVY